MKKTLTLSYTLLFSLAGVGLICALFIPNPYVMSGVIITLAGATLAIMNQWLSFVRELILKYNLSLHKKEDISAWSFENLANLENKQEYMLKRFNTSAEIIGNLSHPEKAITTKLLDASDPIAVAVKKLTAEMEKIKQEDEQRNWVTQGLTRFSEILRNKKDLQDYSYNIVSNLVRHLGANQGGLFIEKVDYEGERHLELAGCYAYDKRKMAEKRIEEGQGLLGQCMLEKDFIFITDVPKDYANITSGLGEATPRNVVIAPLIFNEEFTGVIEILSFQVLEQHHIDFLKAVCEDIASELASLRTIEHTKGLLEESNNLAHELKLHEDEMRNNMEELAATQEEMLRKQSELTGFINAIDSTLATAELDLHGRILRHNAILEQFLEFSNDEINRKDFTLLTGEHSTHVLWGKIIQGNISSGDYLTRSRKGEERWLSITFTQITNSNGDLEKILCMIQNITSRKLKEKEFERLSLVADNTDNSVIITNAKGLIEYVNQGFTKMTGYEAAEVIGRKPGSFLQGPLTDKNVIEKLRTQIAKGTSIYEEILNYNKWKKTYWVSLAINPVKDEQGNIQKYISIQSDITTTKIKALDFHQKMEALSRANAIAELDRRGNILDINDNYLELLDYTREDLIGKPYSLLSHKDTTIQKMLDVIDEHGWQSGVYSRYDKKGNRHHMKLMDYPVINMNGEIEKIIEFGVDVSNEKRLEKETERRQAELKSYLNGVNNTIASAEFGMDGRFTEANDIFLKVIGYTPAELQNQSFEFIMGDDQAVVMMWENLRLGKFFSGEFKMRSKVGKELWLSGTFNPMIIEGDKPEKILMFAQFTTQEKEKLNELTAMTQALKSTIPVIEFTPDFNCKTANEKALKIFGMSRLELRSKTIFDFIAPYYHAIWRNNEQQILNTDFSSFLLPFSTGPQILNYEVSISVTRNLTGEVGKVIVLLVKEVQDKVPVLVNA